MHSKVNPPLIYKSFIGLMVVISWLFPATRVVPFPLNLVGGILFLIGAGLSSATKNAFQKMNTPMSPSSYPNMLHLNGAFRYTRNPMYLGITIGLLGLAMLLGTFINFIFPVLFLGIMDLGYVRREEKMLEDVFGDAYCAYKARVRRWF